MLTKNFYSLIDNEINILLQKYQEDAFIKKHKNALNNQKSYALLIWFLEFYGRKRNYKDFITDGPDDSSCDLVFDFTNNQGNKIFYIVQSKWNNENNAEKGTASIEVKAALQDFEAILRGEKKQVNEKLEIKLKELDTHLKANGEAKFLFLTLSHYQGQADENIQAFIKNDDKIKFEIIDFQKIKLDYIDREYKKIEPTNPLESYHNPEEEKITLEIIQDQGRINIEKPFEASTFLLRPKSIYNLFHKYGFILFYKNVRNPLLQSQFNEEIEKTALENPAYFWYYNNGITAITYIWPKIGQKAETIELNGLQIINGAQTVYAIYQAYKKATPRQKAQMDDDILVTFRLLKSGGKEFDLKVTRYTNSQNPIQDRDFCANDAIQTQLQHASYQTEIWYEKRHDEFRDIPEGVTVISNATFASAYLAYHLQDPVNAFLNHEQQSQKDLNFISHKNHPDGLYEKIFNDKTNFKDMLCAFYIFDITKDILLNEKQDQETVYHPLALFKIAFTKYLQAKFNKKINTNEYIIKSYKKNEKDIFSKTVLFVTKFIIEQLEDKNKTPLSTLAHYETVKGKLEELDISVEDIESINLEGEK